MQKKQRTASRPPLFQFGGIDVPFLIILCVLLVFGLVMMYSASIPTSIAEHGGDASAMFINQLKFAGIGVVAMLVFSQVNTWYLKKYSVFIYVFGILLLIAAFFFDNPNYPDFHRWIIIGSFSFQPSELMKFFLILELSAVMETYHSQIISKARARSPLAVSIQKKAKFIYISESMFPTLLCGGLILLPALLVLLGNHNSGAILILLIGVYMLFIGDFKKGWFITAAVVIVVGVAAIFVLYRVDPDLIKQIDSKSRILSWLDKSSDARWQINNALYAIGSGGLFGVGLGNSIQKYYYVPEPQNDMIFPIICEELGFVGATLVLVLFAALIWRGVTIGLKAKNRFSMYLAVGMIMLVGVQVALNVAATTDLIPNTGIGLPFFSSGGTSLAVFLGQMGILLSISRESRLVKK